MTFLCAKLYTIKLLGTEQLCSVLFLFIRSFFVAKERMPEMQIEEYLDYTIDRLAKKYKEIKDKYY